jgi:hypothetical protein
MYYNGAISGLADTGASTEMTDPDRVLVYGLAGLLAATMGGGVIGYFSSGGKKDGAFIGAALTGGVTGLGDMAMLYNEGQSNAAMITGLGGLFALGWGALAFHKKSKGSVYGR